jgi:hypothetical protein
MNRRRIAGVIVALIIGGGLGYAIGNSADSSSPAGTSSQSAATLNAPLRTSLNKVLGEHAALTVPALKAQFNEEADAGTLTAAVDTNSIAVADTVNVMYKDTKSEFLDMWRKHIGYYQDYLAEAKNNDDEGKAKAKANLAQFADDASEFFASHDTQINKEQLIQDFSVHGEQVMTIIDGLAANDTGKVYTTAHEAYEHMFAVGDTLANAYEQQ